MAGSIYRVRPSNLSKVLACPGSLQLEARFPETEETPEAKEGTAAHEVFSMYSDGLMYKVGDVATNGVTITQDMIDAALMFDEVVSAWSVPEVYVEQTLPASRIHAQCGGTLDAWGFDPSTMTIYLGDLKYGHRSVEVVDNAQLCGYTNAIAEFLNIDGLYEQHVTVKWFIVQPRDYGPQGTIKTHSFYLANMRALTNNIISSVTEAVGENPKCKPSPTCRDCRGRHACVALQNAGGDAVGFVERTIEDFTLEPGACGRELLRLRQVRDTINARIEGLEAQATNYIMSGKRVSNFTVKQTYGREVWRDEHADNIVAMGEMMGISLIKKREPITPAQARKLGFDTEALDLSWKPKGAMKLEVQSTTETRKIFGDK